MRIGQKPGEKSRCETILDLIDASLAANDAVFANIIQSDDSVTQPAVRTVARRTLAS